MYRIRKFVQRVKMLILYRVFFLLLRLKLQQKIEVYLAPLYSNPCIYPLWIPIFYLIEFACKIKSDSCHGSVMDNQVGPDR